MLVCPSAGAGGQVSWQMAELLCERVCGDEEWGSVAFRSRWGQEGQLAGVEATESVQCIRGGLREGLGIQAAPGFAEVS
jgi:hypothetical protein